MLYGLDGLLNVICVAFYCGKFAEFQRQMCANEESAFELLD